LLTHGFVPALSCSYPYHILYGYDKHLAISIAASSGGFMYGLSNPLCKVITHDDLQLDLGQKLDSSLYAI